MDQLIYEIERLAELLRNAEVGVDALQACLVKIAVGCMQRSMSSEDILVCIRGCSLSIIHIAENEIRDA